MFPTVWKGSIKPVNPALTPPRASSITYLPQLDSLRTIAVVMTLLAHFAPVEIPYSWYGVPIFFTISGFLITTILLHAAKAQPTGAKLPVIGNFMIRRVLRLFPAYYLFILFFWFAKNHFSLFLWKDEFTPYFFTYTPNFLIYKIGSGNAGCFAHLWSLGVEEQFYLFWPWVLLFPPAKFRKPIVIGMILFSLTYVYFHYTNENLGSLPFVHFHTLGMGALLALFYVEQGPVIEWLKGKRHLVFLLALAHLVLILFIFHKGSAFLFLYREIALCICTFSVVLVTVFGWKGFMGYIMRNPAVQYIGTISYGIYLYHMPVPYVLRIVMSKALPSVHPGPLTLMFVCFGITIGLAAVSYRFIETPFLKLKRYFA